jgi:hypothetical protein
MKAYPTTYNNYDENISTDCSGMDLRDYFAAKAMQAIITSDSYDDGVDVTKLAYDIADAIMKARTE